MTVAETSAVPLVFDPYDYDFHEDPYPYYRRLRDEAPLYRNDDLKFWALSRHHDVLQGFRNSEALSNANGVSMDKASFGPHAKLVMSFLAMDDPEHLRLRARWYQRALPPGESVNLRGRSSHSPAHTWIEHWPTLPIDLSTSSPSTRASCPWTSSPS
ncbi:putative cytochrome P450 [Mycobacteroides abscessus 1948]|uniref:Putative cytochrome P450 n=1 Tax=Mycobacteroides abscessus 1948 TaxID=1299323 RepID=A0A829QRZ1_9MYCO|nr:putative cytochrome P450 [Mycobacteroides abscessus 1948]